MRKSLVRGRRVRPAAGALALALRAGCACGAPVVTVDTLIDENDGVAAGGVSLRDAIVAVDPGGTVRFARELDGGVIRLDPQWGQLGTGKSMAIDASMLPCGIALESFGQSRVFAVGNIADVTLSRLVIRGGRASGADGGGLQVGSFASLTLVDCTVRDNVAADVGSLGRGGGIFVSSTSGTFASAGTLVLIGTTVADNTAREGGGIYLSANAVLEATNSTISRNTGAGGGIRGQSGVRLVFAHCTITGNDSQGISIGAPGAGSSVTHTILAGNPGGDYSSFSFPTPGGPIPSLGHNLEGGTSAGFTHPTDMQNTDPMLGDLRNNLGPAPTHLLLDGSPAIDSGDPALGATPATDQRGMARVRDGNYDSVAVVDRGATELGRPVVVDTATDESNGVGSGAGTSLREAIGDLGADGGRVLFDGSLDGATIQLLASAGGSLVISTPIIVDASELPAGIAVAGPGASNPAFRVVDVNGGPAQLRRLTLEHGNVGGVLGFGVAKWGGGIRAGASSEDVVLSLVECTVRNNVAGSGGGLALTNGAVAVVERCTFTNNETAEADLLSDAEGGGAFLDSGTLKVINSTFSGNEAGRGAGGGIATGGPDSKTEPALRIVNATIVGNTAAQGGGISHRRGTGTIFSSILANNRAGNFSGPAVLRSEGYNLESGTEAGFLAPGDQQNTDPEIGALADNGGPTETHALGPASPARAAGTSRNVDVRTDQRGFVRELFVPDDLGAFDTGHAHCTYWAWAVETIHHEKQIQPGDDNDGDLLDNLGEYAQALNPFAFDGHGPHGYPHASLSGSGQLRLNFNRMITAKDVAFVADVSQDLENWTEVYRFENGMVVNGAGHSGFTGPVGTPPRVREFVFDPGTPPLAARGFIRLRFELL